MTLCDRILADGVDESMIKAYGMERARAVAMERLEAAQIFRIDNVAKYIWEENEQEEWGREDFPEIRPPMETAFLEYKAPAFSNNRGAREAVDYDECGVLVEQTADVLNCFLFLRTGPKVLLHPSVFCASVSGKALPFVPGVDDAILRGGSVSLFLGENNALGRELIAGNGMMGWGHVSAAMFAVSLLHCRNVKAVEHKPSEAQQKKRARKERPPLVTFKTLEIGSITARLNEAKADGASGLKQALHICRGHFKTFEERPLFGRIRGRFWWPAHVRGDVKQGIALKDYAITREGSA